MAINENNQQHRKTVPMDMCRPGGTTGPGQTPSVAVLALVSLGRRPQEPPGASVAEFN